MHSHVGSRHNSIGIAITRLVERPRNQGSISGKVKRAVSTPERPELLWGTAQRPFKGTGDVKRTAYLLVRKLRMRGAIHHSSIRLRGAVLKYRHNITFIRGLAIKFSDWCEKINKKIKGNKKLFYFYSK
jgi:hypothetical protein